MSDNEFEIGYTNFKVFTTCQGNAWLEYLVVEIGEDCITNFPIKDPEKTTDSDLHKRFYREAIKAGAKIGEWVIVVYEQ